MIKYVCIIDLVYNRHCRDDEMAKLLVIKTTQAIIYVANGKVTLVKNAINGRFMKIAKFANIVNNLMIAAKQSNEATSKTPLLFSTYTAATKLAVNKFNNLSKMAIALLGDMTCIIKRNYHVQGLQACTLALFV